MTTHELKSIPESGLEKPKNPPRRGSKQVTEARARAQRTKLDTQKQEHTSQKAASNAKGKSTQRDLQARRRAATTIARAIEDYLQDHEGGNHSDKTDTAG